MKHIDEAEVSMPAGGYRPRRPAIKAAAFGLNLGKRSIDGVGSRLAVASGKGGVGKSTVSANLAVALARQGLRIGLLDADIYGPSAPTLFGLKGPLAVNARQKLMAPMAHGVRVASLGLLSDVRSAAIWRGPVASKVLLQLCYDVEWGDLDLLVIDLPPGTGDIQITLAENLPLNAALIVTTPQDLALIDAHKAVSMFERLAIKVLGVVENMSHVCCEKCGHKQFIFGDGAESFAAERSLKIVAKMALHADIRLASDQGIPICGCPEFDERYQDLHDLARMVAGSLRDP